MNKTISRVLRTQSWTYCTDKQWLISNVYIDIWEESYVFNADIKKSARSLRSLAILYTFSPVSNASSFNKAIYHEHIKWTNTRTYCTDKNMLLTNLTIARFQRKIWKFRLARLQSVTYAGTYSYCKKKKAILSTTTENLVTPAPPAPDKGSIREIATGEITVSISLLTTILNSLIYWKFERPLVPHPYEKNRMFQTHAHNWIARNHL